MLDETGEYHSGDMANQISLWRAELHELLSIEPRPGSPAALRASLLEVWIGEYTLGHDEQPDRAILYFKQSERLSRPSDPGYGLAKYDIGIALYNEGAYAQAEDTFHSLLKARYAQGYSFRACALWYRHAAASYGYHCQHADAGIPEMPRLDPFCGAAAMAVCLRSLSMPYAKSVVGKACHVTGFGTTSAGIVEAATHYGLAARQLASNDKGLIVLPKPLIAYVENDHFVAVMKADANGVTYLCSECGPWPGGDVNVSWQQWDLLTTGYYITISKPGSAWDKTLAEALLPSGSQATSAAGVRVASAGSIRGIGHITPFLQSLTQLRQNVMLYDGNGNTGVNSGQRCGGHPNALAPASHVNSPKAPGGNCGGPGPLGGDPVNLATGAEELETPTDMTVYNPTGPSIDWQRSYNSMRPCGGVNFIYEDDDYGQGWSQPYNVTVLDPSVRRKTIASPGVDDTIYWQGTDAPAGGATWDIVYSGSVIASSSSPNGWQFGSVYTGGIIPPSGATVGSGYEVRHYTGSSNQSAFFDVEAASTVPQGYTMDLYTTSAGLPANGQVWDITLGGAVIATASQPGGWNMVNQTIAGLQVTAPPGATVGSGYMVRYDWPTGTGQEASFSVGTPDYIEASGTKYVYEANGARVQFSASSVPTASNPAVQCTASTSGTPMLLEWDYSSSDPTGYYTVTLPDRTKWITTGDVLSQFVTNQNFNIFHQLAQIVDRNGNAINFNYGPPAPSTPAGGQPEGSSGGSGFPLLSSITQAGSGGSTLLTVNRTTDGTGHVASVADAYGRSVYYQSSTFATTDGFGDAENMPFVTQVSQIVPTGTSSPSARYSYTYENVSAFGDGNVPFLYQITVPSPTGTGTSTASFTYDGSGAVTTVVDSDGNIRTFTPLNTTPSDDYTSNRTMVTIADSHSNTVYSYTVSFDNNLSETSQTDGTNRVYSYMAFYSDPNDPYQPSAVFDGNELEEVPAGKASGCFVFGADRPSTGVWDIVNPSGTVIATSSSPNGWSVPSENSSLINFTAPSSTPLGSGYEARAQYSTVSGTSYVSGYFTVIGTNALYKSGTALVWDQFGNLHQKTDPLNGTVTNYTWGFPASTEPSVVNSQLKTNAFPMGELLSVKEGTKSATSFAYNEPSGLVSSITSPLPGTTGSNSTVITSFTYDSLGNILTVVAPGNNAVSTITTTYNYTSDPTYSYTQNDAIGQPITVTDNLGNVSHYRYNSRGLLITKIDALGNETDYGAFAGDQSGGYNIADQPLLVTLPATGQSGSGRGYTSSSYLYAGGPLTSMTTYDESGTQVTQVAKTYDNEGQLLSVTGSTAPVSYTYDADYRTSTVTDGNGHTTSYTYNTAGYLYQVAYPGATSNTPGSADTVTYTSYDNAGNPLVRVDGNNVVTDYTYNIQDSFLTDVHYPGGGLADTSFTYDSYGRRATMTDATGSQSYTYDDLDNPLTDTTSFTGGPSNAQVAYTYYPNNSRESMTTPSGGYGYDYDGAGRLTSLTNPFTQVSSWTYLNNNWLKTQTLSNGAVTTYSYNALGEVTDLLNQTSGAVTLSDFGSMVYNGGRDRTTVTASLPGYTTFNGVTNYSYDAITGIGTRHQLTQESSTRNSGYTDNFAYDGNSYGASSGVGNPTTFRGASHSFNSDNQNTANTYNGNGDPTTYAGSTIAYDPENRLTSVGSLLTARYNGDMLRAVKIDSTGTTYYVYDGAIPVTELNSSGSVIATNTFGANGLLSRSAGGSSLYYTFDQQGNVAQRLDGSQNVLTSDLYDAFGAAVSSGTPADPFGFEGRFGYYTDRATGLILCTNRYYDPSQGRFVNRDPISYAGGINLYAYVRNNPISWRDPSGYDAGGDDANHPIPAYKPLGTLVPVPSDNIDADALIALHHPWWTGNLGWFYNMVKTGGPWDFATKCGRKYDNYGNYHYGFVGAAADIPEIVLLNEAGFAQWHGVGDYSQPGYPGPHYLPFLGKPPYGDEPTDQYWIDKGFQDGQQWVRNYFAQQYAQGLLNENIPGPP